MANFHLNTEGSETELSMNDWTLVAMSTVLSGAALTAFWLATKNQKNVAAVGNNIMRKLASAAKHKEMATGLTGALKNN